MLNKELKKYIDNSKVVSFDLFDTLLFRTVKSPADIFSLTEYLYNLKHESKIKGFREKRCRAEGKARSMSKKEDVTEDDIYNCLDYPNTVLRELRALEEDIEIKNCVPNSPMIDVANYCVVKGKQVIITTDIYLCREVIEKILNKLDVKYSRLYLSSEIGLTKQTGNLFDYVMKDIEVLPGDILHIGDNYRSDIFNPRSKGIHTTERICNNLPRLNYQHNSAKDILTNHLDTFITRSLSTKAANVCSTYKLGYEVLGPFVYQYCKWLHTQKELLGIEKMYFLAREGYAFYNAYTLLYGKRDAYYVRINRKILQYGKDEETKKILDNYLSSFDAKGKVVGLINNSINGTSQPLLEKSESFGASRIIGLQFVKSPAGKKTLGDRAFAYVTDSKLSSLFTNLLTRECLTFEHIFFESSGTAISLRKVNDKIEPVTKKRKLEILNDVPMAEMHQGLMDFVKDYKENLGLDLDYLPLRILCKFLSYPTRQDAQIVGGLYDDDEVPPILSNIEDRLMRSEILGHSCSKQKWMPGYIAQRNRRVMLTLFNVRCSIMHYVRNPRYLLTDIFSVH